MNCPRCGAQIGAYALLFALQFRTWKRNYKWALEEASRARKALELYEMMQKKDCKRCD